MARPPKRPRERLLPEDITEKTDGEVVEYLFGKAGRQELERLAGISDVPPSKPE